MIPDRSAQPRSVRGSHGAGHPGRQQGHEGFALLYLDCDRFKQINDNLGHGIGDEVLIAVARRVQHQLRPLDLVCRLGR